MFSTTHNGKTGDTAPVQAPSLSLPKGGGAIRGMGEKFATNPATGTGSMTVPLAVSPGRSQFGPQVSLAYDSGAGNGPFGLGWSLSLPAITRKTDQGLPHYLDGADSRQDSDGFLLSGAEDLVPLLRRDTVGNLVPGPDDTPLLDDTQRDGYRIRAYRPRIEGLFARIERWTRLDDSTDIHWRSYSKDNILSIYGLDSASRIADPEHPGRLFSWLLCETRDPLGNAMLYVYKPENGQGVDLSQPHQRNRGPQDDPRRTANRYLKRIHYGNPTPLLDAQGERPHFLDPALIRSQLEAKQWHFELVLDYGEHDEAAPTPAETRPWPHRQDAFSTYRPGFEVRTARLCRRALMFHHFAAETGVGIDCLVKSTDFTHTLGQSLPDGSALGYHTLAAITQCGYQRQGSAYLRSTLPPLTFEYSVPQIQSTLEEADPASLMHLPVGIDNSLYQWIDLHGEGTPGVLTEQAGAWFYKRNRSPLQGDRLDLAPLERVANRPNVSLVDGHLQLTDLTGEGTVDAVILNGPLSGYFPHDDAESWAPFRPFLHKLNLDAKDPNLRLVDLDGDGRADVLITEQDALVYYPSQGEKGFGPARRLTKAANEEKGPRVVFADGSQSVFLADLSGDGLQDLVRIRHGEICYWPSLGHGRFGGKITMDGGPRLDEPSQFDPRRVRLADIDGSGTTDLIQAVQKL